MTLHFYAGNWREINVEVNGKQVGTYPIDGKDWSKPLTVNVDINLNEGNNVIRLWNDGVWLPDIDKMELD